MPRPSMRAPAWPPYVALPLAGLVALERWRPWRIELGKPHDGLTDGDVRR